MLKKYLCFIAIIILFILNTAFADEVKEITINYNQKYLIDLKDVYRYSIIDPEMIEVKELAQGNLEIAPLKKGTTYLHVWNDKGRTTYKINVNRIVKNEYDWDSSDGAARNNLQIAYTTKFGNGQGFSPYTTNQFSYKWYLHQLKLSGKTPLGDMISFMQVENRDTATDLVFLNTYFNKNNKYFVSLGDTYAHLSNLTMNNLDFQGGYFQGEFLKRIKLTVLGGATGKRYWGGKVWNFPNDKTNFFGGYLNFYINKSLSLYTFGARGNNNNYAINNFGAGFQLKPWNPVKLTYEYAYDQTLKIHAHEAAVDYYDKLGNFSYTFRSIPLNFGNVSNMVSYAGQEGYDVRGAAKILPCLTFDGGMRRYRYSVLQSSAQPANQKYSDYKFGVKFKKIGYPDIYIGRYTQERSFYDGDALHKRTIFSLSHLFYKNNNLKAYMRYEPSSYTKPALPTQNYTNRRVLIGGEVKVFNKIRFIVEEDIQKKNYYNAGTSSTIIGLNIMAYLNEINIPKTPLYFSSAIKYQHESDLALTVPESVSFWQEYKLAVKFRKPEKGIDEGQIYFKYLRNGLDGRAALQIDRDVVSYEYGAEIKFNTKIYMVTPKAYIKGIVYYDKNGNGFKDEDEVYMRQITIKTSKGTETISNNKGLYAMTVKPGEYAVLFDSSQVPKGFISSFNNPDKFNISDGEHKQVDLALISDTGIKGRVFLDSNKNGYRDEGEEIIPDITLLINGQKVKADQNGEFFISILDSGYYQVSYYDLNEIINKYKTSKYQYQVKVHKGKYSNISIPLIAK